MKKYFLLIAMLLFLCTTIFSGCKKIDKSLYTKARIKQQTSFWEVNIQSWDFKSGMIEIKTKDGKTILVDETNVVLFNDPK